jgi:hypothetical protein
VTLCQQFLCKSKVPWHGSVLSSVLHTREVLVLLVGRNGGHSFTLDSGFGLEGPAYLVCDDSQKGFRFCQ